MIRNERLKLLAGVAGSCLALKAIMHNLWLLRLLGICQFAQAVMVSGGNTMTTYQSGDLYLLDGKSQSLSLYGLPEASVFINGSNNDVTINGLSQALIVMNGSNNYLDNLSSRNVTVAMFGHNETITQQSGSPSMTILGFNASDSLNIYGLLPNPNGMGFERPGTPVTAANLRPDGHGGWTMPLSSGSTTYVDFAFTKEATILAAHINVSARAA